MATGRRFPLAATGDFIKRLWDAPLPSPPVDSLRLPKTSIEFLDEPILAFERQLLAIYPVATHPLTPFLIGAIYVAIVSFFNARRPNGKDYLKSPLARSFVILHNGLLALYSGWTFVSIAPIMTRSLLAPVLQKYRTPGDFRRVFCFVEDHERLWNDVVAPLGYLFYLSKYWEVVDSAILQLKGKRVGVLQSYHHYGAMVCMWAAMRYRAHPIWMFIYLNSGIHTLMYTYYTASTLKLPFPLILKRSLTTLQISQFLIGISLATVYLCIHLPEMPYQGHMGGRCVATEGARFAVLTNVAYLAPLTVLFLQFYTKSYRTGPKQVKKVD